MVLNLGSRAPSLWRTAGYPLAHCCFSICFKILDDPLVLNLGSGKPLALCLYSIGSEPWATHTVATPLVLNIWLRAGQPLAHRRSSLWLSVATPLVLNLVHCCPVKPSAHLLFGALLLLLWFLTTSHLLSIVRKSHISITNHFPFIQGSKYRFAKWNMTFWSLESGKCFY